MLESETPAGPEPAREDPAHPGDGAREGDARPTARRRPRWPWFALAVLALALAFQGSRGLWEPDEGFYTNAALTMVRSGDWVLPRLNGELFLDKPPLVYWSIASGILALGADEWGARLVHGLWFLLAALVVGRLGAEWWGERTGIAAMLIYAFMFLPPLAGNFVTPDTPLAAAVALAWLGGWRLEASPSRPGRRMLWGAVLGAAVGLGALAKGPAILVFAAPLGIHLLLHTRPRRHLIPAVAVAAVVFLALALPWYLYVTATVPASGAYLLDNQVMGRLVTDRYARNPGPLGGFKVYLPTLLLGALPWSLFWPAWVVRARRRVGWGAWLRGLPQRPVTSAFALWLALPLGVFLAARSRLPLYVLPLFAPLALATARAATRPGALLAPGMRRPVKIALVAWVAAIFAIKGALAWVPYTKDSSRLARALHRAGVPAEELVIGVDTKVNGLVLYGFREVEMVTNADQPYPFFEPIEHLSEEIGEVVSERRSRAFVVSSVNLEKLRSTLSQANRPFTVRELDGLPYFLVEAPDPGDPAR